jgi:hypothetical protein
MYKPPTYLPSSYLFSYLSTYIHMRPISYRMCSPKVKPNVGSSTSWGSSIHKWVITGIQWMDGTLVDAGSVWPKNLSQKTLKLIKPLSTTVGRYQAGMNWKKNYKKIKYLVHTYLPTYLPTSWYRSKVGTTQFWLLMWSGFQERYGPREPCEWDRSKRAIWMGLVQESKCERDWCMRAIWMGLVQESDVNGIGPRESNVNGISPKEQCDWDWSKRAMWMELVQESNVTGIGPREQCEWNQPKRAMWLGMVQESNVNGSGPREQCEWEWSKRAMWMGVVQESNVNGIGPREQCEWDLALEPICSPVFCE